MNAAVACLGLYRPYGRPIGIDPLHCAQCVWLTACDKKWENVMFCWPCIIAYQYNETNVMHFSFNLLRIKGLYMFRALPTHPQEVVDERHLVYCVLVMSVDCYQGWSGITLTQYTKCPLFSTSWGWASNARNTYRHLILNKLKENYVTLVLLYWFTVLHGQQNINPLTPELNPSAQPSLTRFFAGDFASWTVHFVNICVKNQQRHQLFIQFINHVW
jgi:hypothetical protein